MIGNNNDDESEISFDENDLELEEEEGVKPLWKGLREYKMEGDYFINTINDIVRTTSEILYFSVGFILASPFILLLLIFGLIMSFKDRGVK